MRFWLVVMDSKGEEISLKVKINWKEGSILKEAEKPETLILSILIACLRNF